LTEALTFGPRFEVAEQRLQQALTGIRKPDFVAVWLQTPSGVFSGLKPVVVDQRGGIDRLCRMIYELESGMPR
jgi:hypothetical protein